MKKTTYLYPLLIIAGLVLFGILFQTIGYQNTWKLWQVPTGDVVFLDVRLITGGAESYAAGYDPATNNVKDVHAGRVFNYPRLWYILLAGRITNADAIPLGIGIIALFVLAIIVFPGKTDSLTAILLPLAVFSPAVLLGVERANVDILFFALLTFALLVIDLSPWIAVTLLVISSIFKLFPIFGVASLFDEKRKSIWLALLSGVAFILYLLLTFKDLPVLFGGTAKGDFSSYGVTVLALKVFRETGWNSTLINAIFYLLAITILGLAIYAGYRWQYSCVDHNNRNIRAFRMGAAIYVGTFLIGNNWDYRLVFLLFTIPQLLQWSQGTGKISSIAKITTLGIFISLWHFAIYALISLIPHAALLGYLLDEAVNWATFGLLSYCLVATLPAWMLEEVTRTTYRLKLPSRKTI